ncbi:MAG: helix-turn-helix transcriptional regulator [Candidatus Paceibacterota bacterium]|jgi:transcriptional regulator with XRE-family HTH domain
MSILKKFGQNLKKRRTEKKISQEKLAFIANLHRTYISDVERGNRNISLINIEKIARALKLNLRDLLGD